ncbi:hypothetical protein ACSBL2_07940 [Pedobacter sp. AW31-3R]|uniref:hypothetical protein n=1 Tax=Pedobacter sp. AW31-3R TaxID=3445781 RepID=UPI003FA08675
MNNTFSFQRFSKLFMKFSKEHFYSYLLSIAVIMVLLAGLLGWGAYSGNGKVSVDTQRKMFSFFLLVVNVIFTSRIFRILWDKKSTVAELLLPVSPLERYLVFWLYSFVIFGLVYLALFFMIDMVVIQIGNIEQVDGNVLFNPLHKDFKLLDLFVSYAILHAIAFLGSICFKKTHLIKTAMCTVIVYLFLLFTNQFMVSWIFNRASLTSLPYMSVDLSPYNTPGSEKGTRGISATVDFYDGFNLFFPYESIDWVINSMLLTTTVLLWFAAYYKLKEKQV